MQRHPLRTIKPFTSTSPPLFPPDKPPPRPKRSTTSFVERNKSSQSRPSTAPDTSHTRQATGTRAEDAAANYFEHLGYSILARNLHIGRAEIDLLAQEGDVIVVIEVRTRGPGSFLRPLDSITPAKQQRLRKAGEVLWRRRFLKDKRISRMRFDAVGVTFDDDGNPLIEHVRAAF